MVCPVIVGCRTDNIPPEQLYAFREFQPYGLAIFSETARAGKDAVRHVIRQFRDVVQRPDAPAFIDQEGGSVNRLKPDYGHGWRAIPAASVFADLARRDLLRAREAIYLNAQLIAADMHELDIQINFAPVLDVYTDDTFRGTGNDDVHAASADLRDRMLGDDPRIVSDLGRAFCDGLLNQGVVPVIKHIPGYGRARADPHYTTVKVDLKIEELTQDFLPFNVMADMPAAMTGHVVFTALDPDNSATLSPAVLSHIRDMIGFKNVIITDAIEMNAIWPEAFSNDVGQDQFKMALPRPGMLGEITMRALHAGCDLVLHGDSSRDFSHTLEILEAAPAMDYAHFGRVHTLLKAPAPASFDRSAALKRLDEILAS